MVSVVVSSFHCWVHGEPQRYLDASRPRRAHGPLIMDVSGLVHIPGPVPKTKWGIPRNTFCHNFSTIQRDLARTNERDISPPSSTLKSKDTVFHLARSFFFFLAGGYLAWRRSSKSPQKKKNFRYGTRQKDCDCIPPKLGLLSWILVVWRRGSFKNCTSRFCTWGCRFPPGKSQPKKVNQDTNPQIGRR